MFEVYTEEYIRNRLLNRISDSLSKMEGTILWEIMNSVTIESKEIYSEMENIYNQRIVSTATGDDLTAVCKDFFGVNRKTATKSAGTVRFSGTNGTVISSGTIISTDNGLQYITTATGTVASGYVDIEAKSVNSGFANNVAIGTVTKLVSTISGITTVSNITAMDSGTDIEEDEDLSNKIDKSLKILGDKGYAGLGKYQLTIPIKRNKREYKKDKTLAKTNNQLISRKRIKIEHVFAYMKNFRILQRLNYYKMNKIELFFQSIANIYNLSKF